MIIECKTCKTKYRFDDSVMTPDGIWVRCSRCQEVFLQPPLSPMIDRNIREDDTQLLPRVEKFSPADRMNTQDTVDEPDYPQAPEKKTSLFLWFMVLIFLVLLAGGIVFIFYPSVRDTAIKQVATIFPAVGGLIQEENKVSAAGPAQVKVIDLKQRFVENAMMGNIRIVEGMAVNGSPDPMTRIKVRAELYDMIGTPVRQNVAYCGNLLTDQELRTATEEQIVKKLAIAQGSDISNDRVPPNGMVPFMIIFAGEPPGVTKTLVSAVEAERLLP